MPIINLALGSVIPLNKANNQDNQGFGRCCKSNWKSSHHFSRRKNQIVETTTLSQFGLIPIMLAVITGMTLDFLGSGIPIHLHFFHCNWAGDTSICKISTCFFGVYFFPVKLGRISTLLEDPGLPIDRSVAGNVKLGLRDNQST